FVLPWAGAAGVWLFLSSRPSGTTTTPVALRRHGGAGRVWPSVRSAAWMGTAVLTVSAVVFMVMPRLPGGLVRSLPFNLGGTRSSVPGFAGGILNPGLPAQSGNGVVDFSANAYPGFGDTVDLRARGHLSDQIAFRVRAPQASLWRAEAFDSFDGTQWTITDRSTQPLSASWGDAPGEVEVPPSMTGDLGPIPTVHVTQTFYIDTPQPNVLFAASIPQQVYFPAGGLLVDRYGSIHSPILLDQGLVYSVVSQVPVTTPRVLRLADPEQLASTDPQYLQLPGDLPARDGELARRITAGATTEYDRVIAVQDWIRTHTTYNLDVPSDPTGVDAVDHFLFVTREGFCEQIASSMAILLRTLGIPTRLVTGYGPGERNPLTGYFEVRQSDAHAWVEVDYPGVGWVQYDPTFGVPSASPSAGSRLIGGEVIKAIGRFLSHAIPQPVKDVLRHAMGGLGVVWHDVRRAWPLAVGVFGLLAGIVLARRRRRSHGPPQPVALGAYFDLTEVLAARGHPLVEHATPREYLRRVAADPAVEREIVAETEVVVATLERDRFSGRPAADADLARARQAVANVRGLLVRR
ncbi:MAG: transglutaminase TgpA family protein, partial [Actinomycetota bacterium]